MPVVTPRALTVEVDGRALADEVTQRLVSVRVAAKLNQPTQCELALATSPGPGAEARLCPLGAALLLRLSGVDDPLFRGEVTCFEIEYAGDGTAVLRVRAYDLLHRLRKHQEQRVFEAVTVAELARQLADPVGLTVSAEAGGPTLPRLLQHRHSDLDLLVETAGRAGLYAMVDGDELRLVTLDGYGAPTALKLGESVFGLRVSANLDQATDGFAALGWHPHEARPVEQHVAAARSGRAIALEPDPAAVAASERSIVDQIGSGDDELAALAQSRLDARVASWVTVTGVAEGDGALRPGRRIAIEGVAEPVAGVHVLTEVVHTIAASGHLTSFSTEPPVTSAPPGTASVTLGVVTDADDPDGHGRVRVTLPAYGGLDAGWLAVVCPGAGQGRGIVALPDPHDTVLVVLPHAEPVAGLVLGSLFGRHEPPELGIEGERTRRWSMRTSGGQSIVLDDGGRRLRLESETGSFVELSPDRFTLHAASDLVIEAPGQAMTVRARTVDFVQVEAREEAG